MITSILIGLLLGYILAMPPGPVAVTSINITFNNTRKSFFYYAIGAGLLDVCFGLAAAFASSATLSLFENFTENNSFVVFLLQIVVISIFIIVGIRTIKKNNCNVNEVCNSPKKQKLIGKFDRLTKKTPFLLGVFISGTNIASPAYISLLIYLVLQVKRFEFMPDNIISNLLFSIAFGIGNFLWLFTFNNLIQRNKHLMSDLLVGKIKRAGGILYILFAGILAYKISFLTNFLQYLRFLRF